MKKTALIIVTFSALLLGCVSTSSDGKPKKGVHFFSIAEALASPKGQEVVDKSIAMRFASGGGKLIKTGMVSNKKTNAVNKSAEEACQIAFLSAVVQFQDAARARGGKRVVNLVSYYKKKTHSSASDYECHVGTLMAGVALKGDIAR